MQTLTIHQPQTRALPFGWSLLNFLFPASYKTSQTSKPSQAVTPVKIKDPFVSACGYGVPQVTKASTREDRMYLSPVMKETLESRFQTVKDRMRHGETVYARIEYFVASKDTDYFGFYKPLSGLVQWIDTEKWRVCIEDQTVSLHDLRAFHLVESPVSDAIEL